ncbi:hypothetical protein QFC22_001609 [Naganishia vaughanmartiniae]|uniref:Uncharacterized protein n=1 Tax=Naganishia vaughanmartiniae TaxID=1424756 RepID=A0ACC2XL18_9TREE|nr:hypothetical protein QFC22_001609 [Naganishia vaughanmartiniae]
MQSGAGRPSGFGAPTPTPSGGLNRGGGFLGPRNPIVMRLKRRFGGDRGLAIAGVGEQSRFLRVALRAERVRCADTQVYVVMDRAWWCGSLLCIPVSAPPSQSLPPAAHADHPHPPRTSLERVPETGRLRFIDVSESQESAMGLQATQETLAQYSSALLSPLHPTSRRVREVARRVVESNGLGKMKDAGLMTSLPKISIWGGAEEDGWFGGNGSGEGGAEATLSRGGEKRKDIEWEVSDMLIGP